MNMTFHLPLVGDVTIHLDRVRHAEVASAAYLPTRKDVGGSQNISPKPPAPGAVDPRVLVFAEETRAAVEARLNDASFGVGALSEALGVSRSNLYRRLGVALGQTPHQLIRERRLGRAAELLEARAGRVGEVADAVGYRSTAQFSRAFRDHFGVPPSSYAGGARSPEGPRG